MTSEITKATSVAVTLADDIDPFEAFADAVAPQYILGKLLKFNRGDWLTGENSEPVKQKVFVAGMHTLMTGWVRWRENKPVEHAMVSIGSRLLPPRRNDLGDNDPSTWETDDDGKKKDPWQLTSYLAMIVDDGDGEVFTFATSSKGGLNALGKLTRAYAVHRRRAPSELPVITLDSGGYWHKTRSIGFVKTPKFVVTGWTAVSRFNEAIALAGYDVPDSDDPAVVETAPTKPAVAKSNRVDRSNDMNDDFPF